MNTTESVWHTYERLLTRKQSRQGSGVENKSSPVSQPKPPEVPTSQSGDLTDSLYQFVEAVGVPDVLVTDDAPSLTGVGTCFVKACRQLHCCILHSAFA